MLTGRRHLSGAAIGFHLRIHAQCLSVHHECFQVEIGELPAHQIADSGLIRVEHLRELRLTVIPALDNFQVTTEARSAKGKCRRFNVPSVLRSSLGSSSSATELRPLGICDCTTDYLNSGLSDFADSSGDRF